MLSLNHLERSFIARSVSCELHSLISGHQSRHEGRGGTFSASTADPGFTRHDVSGRTAGDVLRNFHKGRQSGGESHYEYMHSGQSGHLLMRVEV